MKLQKSCTLLTRELFESECLVGVLVLLLGLAAELVVSRASLKRCKFPFISEGGRAVTTNTTNYMVPV